MGAQPRDLNILLVVPYTVPDYSGSGINAFNFARFLCREGHKASILTFSRNMQYPAREERDGVLIRRIRYYNRNRMTKILSLLLILPAYAIAVSRHRLVCIYGGHVIAYQALMLFGLLLRRKVIFQSLLIGEDDLEVLVKRTPCVFRSVLRILFRRLHRYHAINPVFASGYREAVGGHGGKVFLRVQGTDLHDFQSVDAEAQHQLRAKHGLQAEEWIMVSAGFVIRRKGYEEVLEALEGWKETYRYLVLGEHVFTGSHFLRHFQPEAAEIMDRGRRLLGDRIRFMGPSPAIAEYLQMSDLVILSGAREGMPNVLLEAMACGCRVLVRDMPGLRDFVIRHGENGILYEGVEELRHWIEELQKNSKEYDHLGKKARAFIEDHGSFAAVWSGMIETLNQKNG